MLVFRERFISLISVQEMEHNAEGLSGQYEALTSERAWQTDAKRREAAGDAHEQLSLHAKMCLFKKASKKWKSPSVFLTS